MPNTNNWDFVEVSMADSVDAAGYVTRSVGNGDTLQNSYDAMHRLVKKSGGGLRNPETVVYANNVEVSTNAPNSEST